MRKSRGRHATAEAEPSASSPVAVATRPADLAVRPGGPRLGERLVAAGLANPKEIEDALNQLPSLLGMKLGRLLVERGAISEADLARTLADQHELPMVDLRRVTPTDEAVLLVSEEAARRLVMLPVAVEGDIVHVAVADPTDEHLAMVRAAVGRSIAPAVVSAHLAALWIYIAGPILGAAVAVPLWRMVRPAAPSPAIATQL